MKRLVVCVHWHNAPWDPAEFFPVADKVSARLAEIGGRRLTWGADRYAFDFEREQFPEVVQVVMRILTELPGHSVGLALRALAFRQANSGALRACGLALALAEALAVAAGAGEALVDPEIDYQNSGLRKIGVIDVERFDLSIRAATLIPGPSSMEGFFDVPVVPRPSRAPGLDLPHDAHGTTPTPSGVARGPVSKPPLRATTPSRLPPREGSATATPRPMSVRPPMGVRVPHPPRPGHSPPVLVRPSAAPPPLKRPSLTPLSSIVSVRGSETPPPPSTREASLDAEETMPPPSVRASGANGAETAVPASVRPSPARTSESGEMTAVSARTSASGERPSAKPPRPSDSGEMGAVRLRETPPPPSMRSSQLPGAVAALPPPSASVRPLPPRPSASGEMPAVRPQRDVDSRSLPPESADDLVEELEEVETIDDTPPLSAAPPPPSRRSEVVRAAAADHGGDSAASNESDASSEDDEDGDEDAVAASSQSAASAGAAGAPKNKKRKRRRRRKKGGQVGQSPA